MRFLLSLLVLNCFAFNSLAAEPFERVHCEIMKKKGDTKAKWSLAFIQGRYNLDFQEVPQTFAGAFHEVGDEFQNAVGLCAEAYVSNNQNRVRFYTYESDKELALSFNPCKATGDKLVEKMTSFVPERGTSFAMKMSWVKAIDFYDIIHFVAKGDVRTDKQICDSILADYNRDL